MTQVGCAILVTVVTFEDSFGLRISKVQTVARVGFWISGLRMGEREGGSVQAFS